MPVSSPPRKWLAACTLRAAQQDGLFRLAEQAVLAGSTGRLAMPGGMGFMGCPLILALKHGHGFHHYGVLLVHHGKVFRHAPQVAGHEGLELQGEVGHGAGQLG